VSPAPFSKFAASVNAQSALRAAITAATRRPEEECVPPLVEAAQLSQLTAAATVELAKGLATKLRQRNASPGREGLVRGLMQQFALSSEEGIALMCLAEALLRIPDAATRDALIRDKISRGDWQSHLGRSPSLFVNAATWGLLLTGKLVATHSETGLSHALARIMAKNGEPLVRKGVEIAMRLMGEQFVAGETISEALDRARRHEAKGFRYSYDMLGEAAMTEPDAMRYFASYEAAIHAIGAAAQQRGIYLGPGISIKLSALHPRYSRAQRDRVMAELYPRFYSLALLAKHYDIGVNIDAEEADRLELSLDLLERLCGETEYSGWNGIGFVVQAYQKRSPFVIDYLIDLARRTRRRLMVRLVKGAYWDSEIKRAQVDGLDGYPVYTRKLYTDVCYLACARKLLGAAEAIYPQFATHNAYSVAAIYHLAGPDYTPGQYEFQCLHGMGEPLYDNVVGPVAEGKLDRPCRIYAPVGTHETLLAYLVRRLLENGANTSFVNQISDASIPLEELIADPVERIRQLARDEGVLGLPHPRIPRPRQLYGERLNAAGIDLCNEDALERLAAALSASARIPWRATPTSAGETSAAAPTVIRNPAEREDVVGNVVAASSVEIDRALEVAASVASMWQAVAPNERAAILLRAADAMERQMATLMGLAVREAGKSFANAAAEVREAVDYLRYYALQVRERFVNDTHRALGPVVCISPWNFPVAIFTGQIAAALAAGNPVLAKPAEQTPLTAARAVEILHAAGVPPAVLQLLPGPGETVGARLVADARVQGVVFTGSTDVARILQGALATRLGAKGEPIPLIAETGGQNAMIVDSSALPEQVVADVLSSAFDSAGQRCSALRVLCLQEDIAARVLEMLRGAMAELTVGNPDDLAVDVGPVIEGQAQASIVSHIDAMRAQGRRVYQPPPRSSAATNLDRGSYIPPTLIEIAQLAELEREVFGPVLHVMRYRREELDALIDAINALGYGLTLGVHSRIDETIALVVSSARVGNIYVNRNIIGAVVGVQPFGGEGLSGTGPKAGGPLYLYRLLSSYPRDAFMRSLETLDRDALHHATEARANAYGAFETLRDWCASANRADCRLPVSHFERLSAVNPVGTSLTLAGPTGQRDLYLLSARSAVLCLADCTEDSLTQLASVFAVGARAVWQASDASSALYDHLPEGVQAQILMVPAWHAVEFDAVLYHGGPDGLLEVLAKVARRPGPIVLVHGSAGTQEIRLERLLIERVVSVNTAAAGGNTSLMSLG
jgi:RHH-type proline utilization regulon transcriptional repressor/proline dehydrogenase/delta 1-pyrroline-5-carboxylate dehydrogenase